MGKITARAARYNINLTADEAAARVGVKKQSLLNWETGKTKVPFDKVLKLCELYGLKPDEIVFKLDIRK